jgi:hypothetical protein
MCDEQCSHAFLTISLIITLCIYYVHRTSIETHHLSARLLAVTIFSANPCPIRADIVIATPSADQDIQSTVAPTLTPCRDKGEASHNEACMHPTPFKVANQGSPEMHPSDL